MAELNDDLFEDHEEEFVPTQIDPDKDYFSELVGEDRKYRDEKALARAIMEKDQFIERLKQETKGLREELNTSTNLDQFLTKLEQQNSGSVRESGTEGGDTTPPQNQKTDQQFTTEDIDRLIESKVSQREQQRIQERNLADVKNTLTETFGSDYTSKLNEVSKALDMSPEDMTQMAKTKPKAFLRLVAASEVRQETTPQQRDQGLFTPPQGTARGVEDKPVKRTKAFYDKIRRAEPTRYWSPAVQNQMHQDAISMGDEFFDT